VIRALLALLVCASLLAGCGSFGDDENEASDATTTETIQEQGATLAPMTIVTRTPVDLDQIPTVTESEPGPIEVPATYVVQEGDSLYSIAIRFQVDLAEIVALNNLADPNDISVGQELQMPAPEGG
jgi:LysM repeat protein